MTVAPLLAPTVEPLINPPLFTDPLIIIPLDPVVAPLAAELDPALTIVLVPPLLIVVTPRPLVEGDVRINGFPLAGEPRVDLFNADTGDPRVEPDIDRPLIGELVDGRFTGVVGKEVRVGMAVKAVVGLGSGVAGGGGGADKILMSPSI